MIYLKIEKFYIILLFLVLFLFSSPVSAQNIKTKTCNVINHNLYNYISYPELVELSQDKDKDMVLNKKVDFVFNNAIIDNSIGFASNIELQNSNKIGKFIRVASWNIASPRKALRVSQMDELKAVFNNPESVLTKIKSKDKKSAPKIMDEAKVLIHSDIIVLNEVDAGMPRTNYSNFAEELAKLIGYNYVFAPEFLEVDPSHLGIENYKWSEEKGLINDGIIKNLVVDKSKYRGLHGSAILSRFPLSNVRILRLPNVYDWYNNEKNRISDLEDVKRVFASKVVKEDMMREIRVGSRIAIIADINIPEIGTPITIVATHLENRAVPEKRKQQMKFILDNIKNIHNPVIVAGDLNTMCADDSPTSIKKEALNKLESPSFLIKSLILHGNPYGLVINATDTMASFLHRYSDPTVKNIPVLAPNPERALFNMLKDFEFKDGYRFDFRGLKADSINGNNVILSDSNERNLVGFSPTFEFERPLGLGKYKLDWIFVKDYLTKPTDKKGSNKFAPHFGRTLYSFNYDLNNSISDHAPVTVDLPIQDYK